MTIALDLVKKLQEVTGREPLPSKFWENFSNDVGIPTFQDVLDNYAKYYRNLLPSQKEEMSKIFWEQIKAVGTPIIEDHFGSESECDVYFLMPKDRLAESEEVVDGYQYPLQDGAGIEQARGYNLSF